MKVMKKQHFVVNSNKIAPVEDQSSMHNFLHQDSVDRVGHGLFQSENVNKSMMIPKSTLADDKSFL